MATEATKTRTLTTWATKATATVLVALALIGCGERALDQAEGAPAGPRAQVEVYFDAKADEGMFDGVVGEQEVEFAAGLAGS